MLVAAAYGNSIGGSSLHILNNEDSGIVMVTTPQMPNQPAFKVAWETRNATNAIAFNDVGTGAEFFNQSNHLARRYDVGRFTAAVRLVVFTSTAV